MASLDAAGGDAAAGRSSAGASRPMSVAGYIQRLAVAFQSEQDRWFLWLPVMFGLGIVIYFRLPAEPHLLVALMPPLVVLALRRVWRRGVAGIVLAGSAMAIALGFGGAKVRSLWVDAPILPRQMAAVDVSGFVERVEPRPTRGQRLTLRVTRIGKLLPESLPRRVRIRTISAMPGLKPGDAIQVRATLAPPAPPSLPGGHDFARSAWFAGLGGVGYATARPRLDLAAGAAPLDLRISSSIARLRLTIGERVSAALPGETGAIATALITGERGGITSATTEAFRDSGLVHLLSISGLHMVVMAGAIYFAVRLALAAFPGVALRYPIKKWAAAAAISGAFGYLMISGYSFPTVRACIMTTIMLGAILLDRPAIALRNVAIAALIILAFVPESLFDAGFQMSFAAVIALVAAYEAIRERRGLGSVERRKPAGLAPGVAFFFIGIVLTTVVASFAVAPFGIYHFHKSQQFAVLANLIAIPICNAVVMPAALASLVLLPFGLEAAPLWVMGKGIEGIVWCAYAVASLPGAVVRVPAIPDLSFGLAVAGGLWLCLWRGRWRLFGLAVIAVGAALAPLRQGPDVLIGHDGRLIAVRATDGRLAALAGAGSTYELQRWLDHEADGRSPREVASADAFRCDAVGCTTRIKDRLVSLARHPAALADDCRRAQILVLSAPRPVRCDGPDIVIDLWAIRDKGTHAIHFDDRGGRLVTVADFRGERPWSGSRQVRQRRSGAIMSGASRLDGFAAPLRLQDVSRDWQTETEGEEDVAPAEPDDRD